MIVLLSIFIMPLLFYGFFINGLFLNHIYLVLQDMTTHEYIKLFFNFKNKLNKLNMVKLFNTTYTMKYNSYDYHDYVYVY